MALLRQTRPSLSLSIDPDAMEQEEGTISMLKQQVKCKYHLRCMNIPFVSLCFGPGHCGSKILHLVGSGRHI